MTEPKVPASAGTPPAEDIKSHEIKFPCADYPIKVIGETGAGYKALVLEILGKHAEMDLATLAERQSSNGKYTTLQVHIIATGEDQLRDINSALRASGHVHMVL